MPLQNRVTPFSTIEAVSQRGLFMGNRGCLHDDQHKLVTQRWRSRHWIICELSFKGRHRQLMQSRHYTELFFLDEAVALAAGHRPCAECRQSAFRAFVDAWSSVSGDPARASVLDASLHRERVAQIRGEQHNYAALGTLPTGTFVLLPEVPSRAWLKFDDRLLEWSHAGYIKVQRRPDTLRVEVLTPSDTIQALRAGYRPAIHPSANTI